MTHTVNIINKNLLLSGGIVHIYPDRTTCNTETSHVDKIQSFLLLQQALKYLVTQCMKTIKIIVNNYTINSDNYQIASDVI